MSAVPILSILKDGEVVRSEPIEGEAVLGRGEGCVIRLDDRAISRQHAVFRPTPDGIQVERKSEFAPLLVNGADCTSAVVKEGDVINIGPYLMKVRLQASPEPTDGGSPVVEVAPPASSASAGAQVPFQMPGPGQGASGPAPAQPASPAAAFVGDADATRPPLPESELDFALGGGPAAEAPAIDLGKGASAEPGAAGPGGDDPFLDGLQIAGVDGATSPSASADAQPDPGAAAEAPPEPIAVTPDAPTQALGSEELRIQLAFPQGSANYEQFEITQDEVLVGRDKACSVVLNDKKASRKHLLIRRAGLRFTIKDLGSANGTYLNGERITEAELTSGDVIRVGATEFAFQAVSSEYSVLARDFVPVSSEEPTTAIRLGELGGDAGSSFPEQAPDFGGQAEGQEGFDPNGAQPFPAPGGRNAGLQPMGGAMPALGGMPAGAGADGAAGPIPGITGIPANGGKKQSLLEKFRALPPKRQLIWGAVFLAIFYMLLYEDDEETKPKPKPPQAQVSPRPGQPAGAADWRVEFGRLDRARQVFVRERYDALIQAFRAKQWDVVESEAAKIKAVIPDFEDMKILVQQAGDEKRKIAAQQEEARKKAEEEARRNRINQLVQEVADKMQKKEYVQARELFPKIKELEPENTQVQVWEKEIQAFEAAEQARIQAEAVRRKADGDGMEALKAGDRLKGKSRWHDAIAAYHDPRIAAAPDKSILSRAKAGIAECRQRIDAERDPVMAEGKTAEDAQEWNKAYDAYQRASRIDPGFRAARDGMDRVREVLREKAKVAYTEAVLAESYSDYDTATKKYKEVQTIVPKDDLYYERATRKLGKLYMHGRDKASQP